MPPRTYRDFPVKYLTEDLPGIGGFLKETPEDFRVTEIPAYLPSGQGEHIFVFLEKRDLSTPELVSRIARSFKLRPFELGVAGRKDRRAITRQWISIPPVGPRKSNPDLVARVIEEAGARVLEQKRHPHKLKTGHLVGNMFEIVLRGTPPDALPRAREILKRLKTSGIPNFFGPQRFGDRGKNVARGRALLENQGHRAPGKPRGDKRFDLSALQSDLFNRYLVRRMERGLFARPLKGDIMKKHSTGGIFTCEDPNVDQRRVDQFLISPTGPIYGSRMLKAKEESGALEDEILQEAGITEESLQGMRKLMPGGRRICRIPLTDVRVEPFEDGLRFVFFLPKGSYATVLLGEIQKSEGVFDVDEDEDE